MHCGGWRMQAGWRPSPRAAGRRWRARRAGRMRGFRMLRRLKSLLDYWECAPEIYKSPRALNRCALTRPRRNSGFGKSCAVADYADTNSCGNIQSVPISQTLPVVKRALSLNSMAASISKVRATSDVTPIWSPRVTASCVSGTTPRATTFRRCAKQFSRPSAANSPLTINTRSD